MKCPTDTLGKAGVCIENTARSPDGFVGAVTSATSGRHLIAMAELDLYARANGPLPQPEWTASVYRNPDNGPTASSNSRPLSSGGRDVSYDRVHFRSSTRFAALRSRQTDGAWSSRFSISILGRRMRI